MINVYTFNNDTMGEDLIDNGIKEEDVERVRQEIVNELHLGKVIEVEGNYIVGAMTATLLKEKYAINSYQETLI